MNVRQMFSEKPTRAIVAALGLLITGVAVMAFQMRGATTPESMPRLFFSVDDGKTWFADSADKIPPFDKDGKQAVLVHVYRSADGTKFVNYLERFKPDAKRALEAANKPDATRKGPGDISAIQGAYKGGRELKRPGDAKWVNASDFREASKVMAIKAPDGRADAVAVEP